MYSQSRNQIRFKFMQRGNAARLSHHIVYWSLCNQNLCAEDEPVEDISIFTISCTIPTIVTDKYGSEH